MQAKQINCENPKSKPLTLKEWVYSEDSPNIFEVIETSFLEFYFANADKIGLLITGIFDIMNQAWLSV